MTAAPMADAEALELLSRAVELACDHDQNQPPDEGFSTALEHIAARVRGNCGQQARYDREADRARFNDKDFNDWLDTGISDCGHTVYDAIGNIGDAWAGWEAHVIATMPADEPQSQPWDIPQPAAAGGDAVRALVALWDARAKSEHEASQNRSWAEWVRDRHHGASGAFSTCKLELETALSASTVPGRTLYIDLDGVMADFDGAFPAIFGLDHRSLADEEMWLRINGHASFFRDLPPMPGAIDFFRSVEHLQPVILTACPKSNYAHVAGQKRAWVREHLSQTCLVLPVLGGRHKALFMHQHGDVLIDDWGKNCEAWTAAGGIAIKHEGDWIDTRTALSNVFRELESAPAAPSTARALTAPTIGGTAETGAIVQADAEGRSDG